MAEISYRDLLWQVRVECPGVPEPLLMMNYMLVVREHLRRSHGWQYNAGLITWTSTDNFPDASAAIPSNTVIVQPVQVKWKNGAILPFKTRQELDELDGNWEQAATAGLQPDYWTITEPGKFLLYPDSSTTVAAAVELRLAVVPLLPTTAADGRTGVPEELALEFSEHWAHGALAKLLKIPGKDWTDIQLAAAYSSMFEDDIMVAKSRAGADFGRPRRRLRYGGLGMGGSGRRSTSQNDYGK